MKEYCSSISAIRSLSCTSYLNLIHLLCLHSFRFYRLLSFFLSFCWYPSSYAFMQHLLFLLSTSQHSSYNHFFCLCTFHLLLHKLHSSLISPPPLPLPLSSISLPRSKVTHACTVLTLSKLHGKMWLKVNKRYRVKVEAFMVLNKGAVLSP